MTIDEKRKRQAEKVQNFGSAYNSVRWHFTEREQNVKNDHKCRNELYCIRLEKNQLCEKCKVEAQHEERMIALTVAVRNFDAYRARNAGRVRA